MTMALREWGVISFDITHPKPPDSSGAPVHTVHGEAI
jgi:hypothetical protein